MYKPDPRFPVGYDPDVLINIAFPVERAIHIEVEEQGGFGIVKRYQVLKDMSPTGTVGPRLVVLINIVNVEEAVGVIR
jgi:hypothetical protein